MQVALFKSDDSKKFQAELQNGVTLESKAKETLSKFKTRVTSTVKKDYKDTADISEYDSKALKRLATEKLEEMALTAPAIGEALISAILDIRIAAKSGSGVLPKADEAKPAAKKTTAKTAPKADEPDLEAENAAILGELGATPKKKKGKELTPEQEAELKAKEEAEAIEAKEKAEDTLAKLKKQIADAKEAAKKARLAARKAKEANKPYKQKRNKNRPKITLEEAQANAKKARKNLGAWFEFPKHGTGETVKGELVGVSVDSRIPLHILRFKLEDGTRCDKRPSPEVVLNEELTKEMKAAAEAARIAELNKYPKTPAGEALKAADKAAKEVERAAKRLESLKAKAATLRTKANVLNKDNVDSLI